MVSLSAAFTKFLTVVCYLYPSLNNDMKEGRSVDFMQALKRDNPQVVAMLPSLLQSLSPKLHPPSDWPTVPPIFPSPKDGTWIYNDKISPILPTQDPFYSPQPKLYVHLKKGDLISIREVGVGGIFPNASRAFQVSYRSEDTSGNPTADVTMVVLPKVSDGRTLISFQTPEDSASINCSPSYSMLSGDVDQLINMFLIEGWTVNIPDHEGPGSAFGAGIKSGKATLDSIRAMHNAQQVLGFKFDRVGLNGYSGGSIATGHALEMQAEYAPELKLDTAAVGGYVVNLTATFNTINGGLFAGFSPTGIIGLSSEYPELAKVLNDQVKSTYKKRFFSPTGTCETGNLVNFIGQDIYTYMSSGRDFLKHDVVQRVLADNGLGKARPNVPMFIYQGVQDEIAPISEVDNVVDFYCAQNVRLEYSRQNQLEHLSAAVLSGPDVIDFFKRTLNGYVPPPCSSHVEAIKPIQHTASIKKMTEMVIGFFS